MRIPQQTYITLLQKENYSQWIREAIDEKLMKETNPEFLKRLREKKQKEIQQIDEQLKISKENPEKVMNVMEKYYNQFLDKINKNPMWEVHQIKFWIKTNVLPEIKKLRSTKYSEVDPILESFLKWSGRGT